MSIASALGDTSQPQIQILETVVCHQKLWSDWTPGLCEKSLQTGKRIPTESGARCEVQTDERCQGMQR